MADLPDLPDLPIREGQRPLAGAGGGLTERVADADRDRTVTQLREHVVDGRLTLDEFSERVGLALNARTRGDLEVVMTDLPEVRSVGQQLPEPTTTASSASPMSNHCCCISCTHAT